MAERSLVVDHSAALKIILHAAKYPTSSVNGLLIGAPLDAGSSPPSPPTAASRRGVHIYDAIPVSHGFLSLTGLLEMALTQVGDQRTWSAAQRRVTARGWAARPPKLLPAAPRPAPSTGPGAPTAAAAAASWRSRVCGGWVLPGQRALGGRGAGPGGAPHSRHARHPAPRQRRAAGEGQWQWQGQGQGQG